MADPLSALGLGIGVASFILQITDECIKRYRYFTEVIHMPESYRYLRVRVQIEQQRFLSFASEAGLLHREGNICSKLHVNHLLLRNILIEVNSLFEKYEQKNRRYAKIMGQGNISWNDNGEPQTNILELLCTNPLGPTNNNVPVECEQRFSLSNGFRKAGYRTATAARKIRTIFAEPQRLVWVSVDKEEFETLVESLKDLNSFLISLLDASHVRKLGSDVEMNYLELLQLRNDVQSLRTLIEALDRDVVNHEKSTAPILPDMFQNSCLESTVMESKLDDNAKRQYIRTLARLKLRHIEIDRPQNIGTSLLRESTGILLDISLFNFLTGASPTSNKGGRSTASLDNRNVWVEWVEQSPRCQQDLPGVTWSEKRVEMLTGLLYEGMPPSFRAPKCLGYTKSSIHNGECKFGIVFESPSNTCQNPTLETLRQSLSSRKKPPISTRISLCNTLAECLFSFHSVDWLHKGFSSNNILFFYEGDDRPNFKMPYITGYGLSRPTNILEMTAKPLCDPRSDLYRHPHAQYGEADNHYLKSYDMYSLGIVLIEIALWSSIEDIVGIKDLRDARPMDLKGIAGKLLGLSETDGKATNDTPVPIEEAASECGDSYRNIVERCLEADEVEKPAYTGESSTSIKSRLRTMFKEQVTDKLLLMKEVLGGSK
ncbi:prion-inhibition and propagation-domain-containing protein [Rostrohypoxylon terebratum]|nr:prion-inhibition and propagation-domain-containing protein [Rostrohypoxylon terebratum]